MARLGDTIVAPITGSGKAAVTVIRLSGDLAFDIGRQLFPALELLPPHGLARYGRFAHGDEGYAIAFHAGRSFTTEPTLECSLHGSPAGIRQFLDLCVAAGARPAEPGEFTLRAFLHGRLDLTEAEAVRETVDAETEEQLKLANAQRHGKLKDQVSKIRAELLGLLAAVEASVDFSEEVGELDEARAISTLNHAHTEIGALRATAATARMIREGYRIAIVGAPNVGKSSLFNALLAESRALVTELAGTTRDTLEESVDFQGRKVVLTDTAGLRSTSDLVERLGIERTHAAAATADEIWLVYDASAGLSEEDRHFVAGREGVVTLVANKCDLNPAASEGLAVSATRGLNLDRLIAQTVARIPEGREAPIAGERHAPYLAAASEALDEAIGALKGGRPADLLSTLLRESVDSLGRITGETADAEMIDRLFAGFCIGK